MLRAMRLAEYSEWQRLFIEDYAADLRVNYGYSAELALERAHKSLDDYLPQGLESPRQVLLSIEVQHQVVGYLWYQQDELSAYILDFLVLPACRGNGYAKQAMQQLAVQLRQQGIAEIKLRVAANNSRAKALYEACQFQVTGYNMSRSL